MTKTTLTIGLFDKDTESQKISTESAKSIIADILLNRHSIFAFTMIDCSGYYKMQSTGNIVNEPSIRVEIATDDDLRYGNNLYLNKELMTYNPAIDGNNKNLIESKLDRICKSIKTELNQESVMVEVTQSDIQFL